MAALRQLSSTPQAVARLQHAFRYQSTPEHVAETAHHNPVDVVRLSAVAQQPFRLSIGALRNGMACRGSVVLRRECCRECSSQHDWGHSPVRSSAGLRAVA